MLAVLKRAFEVVGLDVFAPHRFRDMIISEAYRRKLPPDELKAWSQNLGYEGLLTTLTSYGELSAKEQGQLAQTTQ